MPSVGALLRYVSWTQGGQLPRLSAPLSLSSPEEGTSVKSDVGGEERVRKERETPMAAARSSSFLELDAAAIGALEVLRPTHGKVRQCYSKLGSNRPRNGLLLSSASRARVSPPCRGPLCHSQWLENR